MHTNSTNQEYKHPHIVNGEKHKPKVCYKSTKDEFKSWQEEKTKENQPQVKQESFYLVMWTQFIPNKKIVRELDGNFRNCTVNDLIDYLYTLYTTTLAYEHEQQQIVQRIYEWRNTHLKNLEEEIKLDGKSKREMGLWLRACEDGEKQKWRNISTTHPIFKDCKVVDLDARLSDYIFHDKELNKDTLVIEANYVGFVN